MAIGALIAFSSFSALKKQNENELAYQKLLETEEKNYLMGKFDPAERKDFIHIPIKYTIGENGKYLRQETWDAFLKMHDQAEQDGIRLRIASATRNFDYQKNIWESKWKNFSANTPDGLERFKKILEWSSVPGTSRHHWGTDIDINSANASYFESEKGIREYIWLVQNGPYGRV
ncbi:MAG: D-alanyl-D-alanine carboxypeptidase [Parcubacteria group bacterium GW2011_GWA2_42_11]|nr:MAG: D-alanyl-D-alanine carboxypeptidase [Parcubacteria group bacterium GW2011_GWA2_42_11]